MSIDKKLVDSLNSLLDRIPPESSEFVSAKDLLDQLRGFFEIMQTSNPDELQQLIKELESQPPLFNEIGKIVRSFYEQMVAISTTIPERLGKIANVDMEDANQRLQHIVSMTENAANKTMDLAEELLEGIGGRTSRLDQSIASIEAALKGGGLSEDLVKTLQGAGDQLKQIKEEDDQYQASLTDILVAQDYQDLTGQVINKIVNLMNSLENDLIVLIETFGQHYAVEKTEKEQEGADELKGPLHEEAEEKSSQGDVDDLLSSLGF